MTTLPFKLVKWDKGQQLLLVKADTKGDAATKLMGLSAIDGVAIEDIIALAKERAGIRSHPNTWLVNLPGELAPLMRELDPSGGLASGVEGAKSMVELEDPDSHEIDSYECVCSVDNLMHAVANYEEPETAAPTYDSHGNYGTAEGGEEDSGAQHRRGYGGDAEEEEEEEEEGEGSDEQRRAYLKKRNTLELVGNAFATAAHLAAELGLSPAQIDAAWVAAGGRILSDEEVDAVKNRSAAAGASHSAAAPMGEMPPEMAAMMGAMGGMGGMGGATSQPQQCQQQ